MSSSNESNLSSVKYTVNPQHRNNSPSKSQWIITQKEEVGIFSYSQQNGWLLNSVGWGLYFQSGQPNYLGKGVDRQRLLFVAKFVDGTKTNEWHGYPADHQSKVSDIPEKSVMFSWVEKGFINLAKLRKLTKAQPCHI